MSNAGFVHLHVHSAYSLLKGSIKIAKLGELAKADRQPALALTDTDNMFGALEFSDKMAGYGVQPIIGCELAVDFGDQDPNARNALAATPTRIVLLAARERGYRSLMRLNSRAFLETPIHQVPHIKFEWLQGDAEDLIALTGGPDGPISLAIAADQVQLAATRCDRLASLFGDRLYVELQRHGVEKERRAEAGLIDLAYTKGLPLVATNEPYFAAADDFEAHDALLCIAGGRLIAETEREQLTPDHRFKTRAEMAVLFADVPEALASTVEIAERCSFRPVTRKPILPRFTVGANSNSADAVSEEAAELRRQAEEGLTNRLRVHGLSQGTTEEDYRARLAFELDVITRMQYPGYFLIVADFIKWAKSEGIPVGPGRGSAAGSLVGYAMAITDIDPLQYGLLFERFLNPERVNLPDIDVDFCMNRRGEVIHYVTEKYGREQVAQIITFNTLGARAAIKDVGRVLEIPYADVDKLTKLVPNVLNISLGDAIKQEPGFAEARKDPRIDDVLKVALRLEGLSRNCSVHAAGVVISPQPLRELVPLYKTNRDEIVTQFDMNGLEKLSLLKMDFLGLTTLTLIEDALRLIKKRHGVEIIPEDLPLDDAATYEIFCKGFTSGVFQFESQGMRDILLRYKPSRLEDLTALNALYRPGPIQGGMVDDFIERKWGRRAVQYDLPELKELLEETYGVIVYQEQVMQISNRLAGYSLGEADLLRRAMGKKKAEAMAKEREHFVQGAVARGFAQRKVEKIFDLMEQFAGYGFNKSHSAAYAYLAFVTAYLKAHYPVDFMAALLTSETGNTLKVVKYINECRAMGITILPPDVNQSEWNFTPDAQAPGGIGIRFGLGAVKNLGQSAVEAIGRAREPLGRFRTIHQFAETVDLGAVNRRMIESLIRAGAMDSMEGTRAQKFAAVEGAMEAGQRAHRDRESGQTGLFGELMGGAEPHDPPLPNVPDWTEKDTLAGEKELLGFWVTGHPLDRYQEKISELATRDTASLEGLGKNAEVALCGVLRGITRKRNKEGKPWVALTIEDQQGSVDGMVFASSYERLAPQVVEDQAVLVRGLILPEENAPPKVSVQDIIPLDVARVDMPSVISIRVWLGRNGGTDRAAALDELFKRKPGETQVRLRLESPRDFSVLLDVAAKVRPDKEFRAAVEAICGAECLERVAG